LSSLTTAGGALSVTDNAGLGTLTLSSLTTVGGALSINTNALLTTLNLSVLRQVGVDGGTAENLVVSDNAGATPPGSIFNIILPPPSAPPPVQVFGALRIFGNTRISDADVAILAQRFSFSGSLLTGNTL
jgi:hypothetical protein